MTRKTILIASGDRELKSVLTAHCRQLGLEVLCGDDLYSTLPSNHGKPPEIILWDADPPGDREAGSGSVRSPDFPFPRDETLCAVPMIVLSREGKSPAAGSDAKHIYPVVKGSDLWLCIAPVLCELMGIALPEPAWAEGSNGSKSDRPPCAAAQGQLQRLVGIITRAGSAATTPGVETPDR